MAGLPPRYRIEHYEDQNGDAPVHRWLLEELTPPEATILGIAMRHHLQERGPDVVETRHGRYQQQQIKLARHRLADWKRRA